jgi:multidrug efflux pump subunit AcrA (membrane-fusion protein)
MSMVDFSSVPRVRSWSIALVGLLALAALGWWLGARAQSPSQAAARAAEPSASWITARVERRVLASTVVLRGDVRPEVSLAVGVPSSVEGAGVVTRVPPVVGSEVAEGALVLGVSGRPVFVLRGAVPVYRSLKPGMSGADVAQLQAALVRLGYAPETSGVFGEATKVAVSKFYAAAGFEPIPSATTAADVSAAEQALRQADTGLTAAEDGLVKAKAGGTGSVVAAAQAGLNQANRALVDAQASRDEAVKNAQVALTNAQHAYDAAVANPGSSQADRDAALAGLVQAQTGLAAATRHGDDAVAAAADQVRVATLQLTEAKKANDLQAAQAARDNAVASRDAAAAALAAVAASTGPTVAQGEMVFIPTAPARVQSAVTSLGPIGTPTPGGGAPTVDASALVTLAAGDLVVSTAVRAGDEGLVRVGMPVELLDETTNTNYPAKLSTIADTPTADPSGTLSRAATVVPDTPLPASLAGVNLRVTITAAASDGEVLVVPLAAVSSTAAGATRVSVLAPGTANPVDVPVTSGISADGFVAVTPTVPAGLKAGDLVVVGR